MMDFEDFYFTGLPIQTEIGECHFLKVKEYPDYFSDLQIIGLTKEQLIFKYEELNKNVRNKDLMELIDELKKVTLFQAVINIPELSGAYFRLFSKVFRDEESVSKLNEDNFSYHRKLVMKMNCIKEEIINPNPEIQRAIERSRRVKAQEGEKMTLGDMASSIVGHNGLTYDSINEFTIYQFYLTYARITQIKNYDTSTLFATVSSDKIKIDSWSKHINLFEDEKHTIEHEKFKKTTGSVFNE